MKKMLRKDPFQTMLKEDINSRTWTIKTKNVLCSDITS